MVNPLPPLDPPLTVRQPRRRWRAWVVAGLAAVISTLALTGCGVAAASSSSDVAEGRRLYKAECVSCHGDKGDRIPASPMASAEFLSSRGDATLMAVLAEGKGVMPAYGKDRGGPFNDDQIRAVLAYLNSAAGRTSSSLLAEEGRKVFKENCVRCHGEKADRIPAAPLNAKGFLDTRTDSELVRTISEGKGLMPAWAKNRGGSLGDDQIRSAVAYLRYNVDVDVALRARQGRELYVGNCLSCHGERGDRVPSGNLASSDYLAKLGDGALIAVISDGKGLSPAFGRAKGGSFGIAETAALLAYLKSWAGLRATAALAGPEQVGTGRDLFVRNCTPCHGETGDKVSGVQLKSKDFLSFRTDRVIRQTIVQGNAKGMPSWGQSNGGPFADGQIDAILQFLKSAATPGAQALPPAAGAGEAAGGSAAGLGQASAALVSMGKEIFTKTCVACHGETRDKVPTCKLADKDWLSQKGDKGLVDAITNGKPPMMPTWDKAKGGPLGDDEIQAVAAYLKDAAGLKGGATAAAPASGGGDSTPSASPGAAAAPAAPSAVAGSLVALSDSTTPSIAVGKEVFTKNCVMCHGADGMNQPACRLGSKEWLQNMSEEGLRARITTGKPASGMPTWGKSKGGPLGDNLITAVMMYLYDGIKP
ncbi:MAG: c-type cytochrome [Chloroflexi bacterium]|nr:c-type cytochrome [Chloroflexota bacterium]